MKKRKSGVLLHISSLPNELGIGTFGKSAYDFVDFLKRTKQKYWQILPLTTTSYGDSPYQSFSAIAGNTNFIDFEILEKEGFLESEDYKNLDYGNNEEKVDYEKIFYARRQVYEKIYKNFKKMLEIDNDLNLSYEKFKEDNKKWLNDFADFMAIKEHFNLKSLVEWDEDIKNREDEALDKYRNLLKDSIENVKILQYLFFKQWLNLKKYANENNIKIIGDMPFYVAEDSVEMWCMSYLFDKETVAGCPPDAFSDSGQLWGNPIYNWEEMEKENYKWWKERLKESFKLYDTVRIDHFKGFSDYWAIIKGSETAANGSWKVGPRMKLFNAIKEELGELDIIAEDLGYMDENSIKLREDTKYPGMKILQFGFFGDDSVELPHNHLNNCVVYTGTHDNDVINGWYENLDEKAKERIRVYTNQKDDEKITDTMLRTLFSSVAYIAILTMQDLLDKGSETRMNYPSTIGNNWVWRMKKDDITKEVEDRLTKLTKTYNRENE